MDQVAILENLERVAGVLRRGGLHRVTRLGRRFINTLLKEDLSVTFDSLSLSGPMELRGQLYQARSGRLEPLMSALFRNAVSPHSVVLDVGACLGYYSLLAAKYGAKVYAFEPTATSFAYLLANIQRNEFGDRIIAVSKAVSDKRGTMPFFIHDNGGLNSLFRNAGKAKQKGHVDTIAIDEYLDDVTTVHVIKIDIEGGEMHALSGMERTLRRSANPKLFVECNGPALRCAGSSPQGLVGRLSDLGFHVMIIDEHNGRLAPVTPDIEVLNKQLNLYCVRHK